MHLQGPGVDASDSLPVSVYNVLNPREQADCLAFGNNWQKQRQQKVRDHESRLGLPRSDLTVGYGLVTEYDH